jgi:hypothetical protein
MDDSALLAGALFAYAALLLGGPWWLLPPMTQFLVHTFAFPRTETGPSHSVDSMIAHTGPALLVLLLDTQVPWAGWGWAYTTIFTTQLAIVAASYRLQPPPRGGLRALRVTVPIVAVGYLLIALPMTLVLPPIRGDGPGDALRMSGVVAASALIFTWLFVRSMPRLYADPPSLRYIHPVGVSLTLLAATLTAVAAVAAVAAA